MTYAPARAKPLGELLRPSAYTVSELRGLNAIEVLARRAHYELIGSHALSVRRGMLGEHLRGLHQQWRAETGHLSSLELRKEHPAYKAIVAMGDEAIPLILDSLAAKPDLLVMALHDITREDPVLPDHHGRLSAIVQDWLRWGQERGHRP